MKPPLALLHVHTYFGKPPVSQVGARYQPFARRLLFPVVGEVRFV